MTQGTNFLMSWLQARAHNNHNVMIRFKRQIHQSSCLSKRCTLNESNSPKSQWNITQNLMYDQQNQAAAVTGKPTCSDGTGEKLGSCRRRLFFSPTRAGAKETSKLLNPCQPASVLHWEQPKPHRPETCQTHSYSSV